MTDADTGLAIAWLLVMVGIIVVVLWLHNKKLMEVAERLKKCFPEDGTQSPEDEQSNQGAQQPD